MGAKTKVKVDAEQLRGFLNTVTDVYSYFMFNKPEDRSGKSLQDDVGEVIGVAAYLVDVIWKSTVFHKNGQATVHVKDFDELLSCSEEVVSFCNQYLRDEQMNQVGEFLGVLEKFVNTLKGV